MTKGTRPQDAVWTVDGVAITDMALSGSSPTYFNYDNFDAIHVATTGQAITQQTGGAGLNFVVKRGTNLFHGGVHAYFDAILQHVVDDVSCFAQRLVRDFLRSDVDISLPSCDLLLASVGAVMSGDQERWRWNGNSFLLRVEKSVSRLTDKYEDENGVYRSADLPTAVLPSLIRAWREFVFELPRQRELEAVQRTAQAAGETK